MDSQETATVKKEIEVRWGDMDALGHVNNTVFFRYFETARIAYFDALEGATLGSGLLSPILASASCEFKRPVVYPDTLTATTRVIRMGKSSLTMSYELESAAQSAVVATGEAVIVNVDTATGKSVPIAAAIRQRICKLEGREFGH